ncbi:hypothetical protein OEZ86_009232 [Tetradesmus obliquus]|nr:hypothetical protein OEZ86_009232 [Tetradesmus obliquus]
MLEPWRFSVMSYNILADKYARHYRSYLYDNVPSTYLDWSHRRAAILAELAHLQPDILCLQEVDRYEELEAELEQLGYAGIYLQRDGGRLEQLQLAPEWQRCGLLVANTHIIFTPDKGEVKLGQARMLVQEASQMAEWYLQQQQELDEAAAAAAGSSSSSSGVRGGCAAVAPRGVATIIAGDFNATPHSPMYTFLSKGCVDLHKVNKRNVSHMSSAGSPFAKGYRGFRRVHRRRSTDEQRSLDSSSAGAIAGVAAAAAAAAAAAGVGAGPPGQQLLLRHGSELRSSYASVLGQEPEYTSSHSLFMDTCDYVFYDANPVTLPQQQQQQQQQQAHGFASNGTTKDTSAAAENDGSSDSSSSSGDDSVAAAAAPAAATYGYELQPVAVLLPPDGMKLSKGLPSRWLGSDHVCLVVDFELSLAIKGL